MALTDTFVRLPRPVVRRRAVQATWEAGHPMNAEIIARLSAPSGKSLQYSARQNEKTQEMIQTIIDAISPRR